VGNLSGRDLKRGGGGFVYLCQLDRDGSTVVFKVFVALAGSNERRMVCWNMIKSSTLLAHHLKQDGCLGHMLLPACTEPKPNMLSMADAA